MNTTGSKGMRLSVYSNPKYRQCAAGGISERVEDVTVVGIVDHTTEVNGFATMIQLPRHAQVFEPTEDAPAVVLVLRRIGREVWHVTPADAYADDGKMQHWYAAGGSYVATTESRLSELTGHYGAFALHDRKEW